MIARKCYGINPRTGRKVGERHRWPNGWGIGRCIWCRCSLEEVQESRALRSSTNHDAQDAGEGR